MTFYHIKIHSNNSFLIQWNDWILSKVGKHFKRNKERIHDTAQSVRLRLLSKDFIGRWFYKHLTEELVDRTQAEKILGKNLIFIDPKYLSPVFGEKNKIISLDTSIWKISDILKFARFDHERYFYSYQNHTIDSDRVLKLLGYQKGQYSALQSMYRTGRLLPSEFTEHKHTSPICLECEQGKNTFKQKGISLSSDWNDPKLSHIISKLRWKDTQLIPFLRNWKNSNTIQGTPEYVMREDPKKTVDAGLLKYAEMIIDHEVYNDFKRMSRTDDLPRTILNDGVSPELNNENVTAYESTDDSECHELVFKDSHSLDGFNVIENKRDLDALLNTDLFEDEKAIIDKVELGGLSIKEYSDESGITVAKVHRLRTAALKKIRHQHIHDINTYMSIAQRIAKKYKCSITSMLNTNIKIGKEIMARSEFFMNLSDAGLTPAEISMIYGFDENRITESILRRLAV